VSATPSTCIYERSYLSAPSVVTRARAPAPVSARAPVDNAIEASIEAIEAISVVTRARAPVLVHMCSCTRARAPVSCARTARRQLDARD
jgi:hypothetical protein